MMNPPVRPRGAERRRNDLERIKGMAVKPTRLSGRTLIEGSGEVVIFVPFAVTFSERPTFTFGGELDVGVVLQPGKHPTVSAIVSEWEREGQLEGERDGRYTGANIAVVVLAPEVPVHRMWLHYVFEGFAMQNPAVDF